MLSCLRIRDLAIIDSLELELGTGLNVLTGETGAGKSILVSALELVLGGKGRPELVRTGAKGGEVEAAFDLAGDEKAQAQLRQLELEGGDELVVRRVISACGKTRAFINGKLATQQTLASLTRGLADISSQHEHHTLSDPSTHTRFLDAFAGAERIRETLGRGYARLCKADAELQTCEARARDRAARELALERQIAEIEEVAPEPDEDVRLEQACTRMRGVEALLQLTASAAESLYEGDHSVVDALADATRQIREAAEIDPALSALARDIEAVQNQLADAARELGKHVGAMRPEPEALQLAEERLYRLTKLKRRHGGSLESVLAHLECSRAELEELRRTEEAIERAAVEKESAMEEAAATARELSRQRRKAAAELGAAISRELESLGMGGALVRVDLTQMKGEAAGICVDGARLSAEGLERAELLIAPNRGEAARALARVASGGELSRAMLAIKCVLADLGPAGMYVFDEVDTGVGGGMAEVIGRKIHGVARHRQVLCITHLPQIAVFADHHFKVEKLVNGGRTTSSVRRLSKKEQPEEIARMLGGLQITTKTRAAARELLLQARRAAA